MRKLNAVFLVLALLTAPCVLVFPRVGAVIASENTWETMKPMPMPRTLPGIGVVNGKIYVIGGGNRSGAMDVNEMYDPATNTWTKKRPMPQADSGFATAVYQSKVYCFGYGVNQVYDTATDAWEIKTADPTPRDVAAASVVNGKIYVIGGFDSWFAGDPNPSKLNEMYDPVTDSWTTMAPLPTAVAYCISTVVDNRIYVFGNTGNNNETQIYDPQIDTWSYGPSMPNPMAYETGAATAGVYAPKRIYLVGGLGVELTQIFDPETETWSIGASMPTPRRFLSVAVADDLLYAIGGYDNAGNGLNFSNANERYVPFGYVLPLIVSISSPQNNQEYGVSSVPLTFALNRYAESLSYSLDGAENVSISGNTTLNGLANGEHTIVVYATDNQGKTGISQTIYFTITRQENQPPTTTPTTPLITAAEIALAAVITFAGIGMIIYSVKRKNKPKP